MNWLEFLAKMENSLNCIEVRGKENMSYLLGCLVAIEGARNTLMSGGEVNGRQSDTGLNSGNNSE